MKVIGKISPEFEDNSGQVINSEYMGGAIVMLRREEEKALALLQEVWDGDVFRFNTDHFNIDERNMEDAFKAIRVFIEAKLAVNEFKITVDRLSSLLIKDEEAE